MPSDDEAGGDAPDGDSASVSSMAAVGTKNVVPVIAVEKSSSRS